MGGFKLTGLAAGSANGNSVRYEQLPSATNQVPWASTTGIPPLATRIDVASVAGTVDLTANAPSTDDIRITGALAITAFTIAIGRVIRVTAGGAFTLANNASISTGTGGTVTCAVGVSFMLRATAANVVEVFGFARGPAVVFGAYQSTLQSLPDVTFTKINFQTVDITDTAGAFASSRYTATLAGYYQINGGFALQSGAANGAVAAIYKNGVAHRNGQQVVATTFSAYISSVVYLAVGDYVEIFGFQNNGTAINTNNSATVTYFNGALMARG